MRHIIRDFVKICATFAPITVPIYEFGAFQVPGQEDLADLRPLFPHKEFWGADMREGRGVDIVLDLHDIKLASDSVGTVLVLDTLEHVEFPRKAITEIYRILKRPGMVIMSSVMNFPIHDYPSDYWRFTPEGFKSLLNIFDYALVEHAGKPAFPHTVVGIGVKGTIPDEIRINLERDLVLWRERSSKASRLQQAKELCLRLIG
jgi:hypothetical protein